VARDKVLVTVKAYSTRSRSAVESSCTAGVTTGGQWIRLHPLNWRRLSEERRFEKWDVVNLEHNSSRDPRPEGRTLVLDSIEVEEHIDTGPKQSWADRYRRIMHLESPSLEDLWERQK